MGTVEKIAGKVFDVTVMMVDDREDEIACVDLKINEDNTLLTLTTVTGRHRTYYLPQILWFETG